MHKTFDHIIIGGGSAGCVAAERLARSGRRVALLESGASDEDNQDALNAGRWKELVGSEHDYDYRIEPQPRGNSTIRHTRGKILGGTSSINTIIAWKTPEYDLQKWVELGARSWELEACESAFEYVFSKVHVEHGSLESEFHYDLIAAAEKAGLPLIDFSPSSTVKDGIGYLYFNKKGNMRQSASVAFLHPLAQWGDALTIFTNTRVEKLLFDSQNRAVGVKTNNGRFFSNSDIILSCGAFDTPTLLMRSGIGQPDQLRQHGIAVRHELNGVGEHLLDHPDSMIAWETNRPIPQLDLNAMGMAMFGKSDASLSVPDMMLHVGTAVFDTYTKPHGYPTAKNGFSFSPNVARARSEGTVKLRSANPNDPPIIDFRYFTNPYDEKILVEGIKLGRRVAQESPLKDWIERELFPGTDVVTDEDISAYGRKVAGTVYHPAGTCKMGDEGDLSAVVDPHLRVRGIGNLRVADASIFPSMIGVNPNMTCMMIGARCAEFVLG